MVDYKMKRAIVTLSVAVSLAICKKQLPIKPNSY